MICGLLRADGYAIWFLGQDVDVPFLMEAVRAHHPAAVLLSARAALSLPAVQETANRLQSECPPDERPHLIVGGRLAAEHRGLLRAWDVIPVTEDRPGEAAAIISALVHPAPPFEAASLPTA
jgi:hypothetical protein